MEQDRLREMMRHPNIKQAYANKFGIDVNSVSVGDNYTSDVVNTIPASLFLDFNKDEEEIDGMSIYNNLNAYDYNNNSDDRADQ